MPTALENIYDCLGKSKYLTVEILSRGRSKVMYAEISGGGGLRLYIDGSII